MRKFNVNLEGKETEICISDKNILDAIKKKEQTALLVTDTNLIKLNHVINLSEKIGNKVIIKSGEKNKTFNSVEKILKMAVKEGLDRSSVIVGLGGGVICDTAAFAAAIYMRGCKLILVPTSLLAMVDASIGGKTGVDFFNKKNIIGSFYPAERVEISTVFLESLPEKEFKSGLAEIIKHALLSGEDFLSYVEKNKEKILFGDLLILKELIYKSLKVKASYIEKDFRENGIRAHLNLGHTFGHALETATGLELFTHGEAVAWGIHKSLQAGILAGITDKIYAERVSAIFRSYGYNIDFNDIEYETFIDALKLDKKRKDGKLNFIIQKDLGKTGVYQLSEEIIKEVVTKKEGEQKNRKVLG